MKYEPYTRAMSGMLKNTGEMPRQTVEFVLRVYGTLSQNGRFAPQKYGKAMVWILADRTMVIVQNNPANPNAVVRSTYPIDRVEISPKWMEIKFPTPVSAMGGEVGEWEESSLGVVAAPCVCGAGPTGIAAPVVTTDGVYLDVAPVTSMPNWVSQSLT